VALSLRAGTVTAVGEAWDELVRCEVDGVPCIAYPRITGPVAEGDTVLVNIQARVLGLGSGGFDVLYANLTRGLELAPPAGAHVMALPYTPCQAACRTVEEGGSLAGSLVGMPVVCTGLHSQLAPVAAGIGGGRRVGYLQLGGGALPVSLSDTVRELKQQGLLEVAVAVAPCHDGDVQAISVAAALLWAKAEGLECVVCGIGPGIVGTGTRFGHGGTAVADAANATAALHGRAIVVARVSHGDERERHRGVSHHTRAALALCLGGREIAWPRGLDPPKDVEGLTEVDVHDWREACSGLRLAHMGRGREDDPWFFAAAFAAGRLARAGLDG
jgi:hypothetical protein